MTTIANASLIAAPGLLLVSGAPPLNATFDTVIAAYRQGFLTGTAGSQIATGADLNLCSMLAVHRDLPFQT